MGDVEALTKAGDAAKAGITLGVRTKVVAVQAVGLEPESEELILSLLTPDSESFHVVRLCVGPEKELRLAEGVRPTVHDVLECRVDHEADCVVLTPPEGDDDPAPVPAMTRKTVGYPTELLEFVEDRGKLRGNDLTSMLREALYQWAAEYGYHRWRRRKSGRRRCRMTSADEGSRQPATE